MGVIEFRREDDPVPEHEWARVVSPYGAVWKKGRMEIRPVFDCSISGLNGALAPWPFEMVQVEDILRCVREARAHYEGNGVEEGREERGRLLFGSGENLVWPPSVAPATPRVTDPGPPKVQLWQLLV